MKHFVVSGQTTATKWVTTSSTENRLRLTTLALITTRMKATTVPGVKTSGAPR
jgi:O-succinylbenzoate synthase